MKWSEKILWNKVNGLLKENQSYFFAIDFLRISVYNISSKIGKGEHCMRETRTIEFKEMITNKFFHDFFLHPPLCKNTAGLPKQETSLEAQRQ